MKYNLSICCVDGDTIYGLISSDKKLLKNFLDEHDHEGSTVSLVQKNDDGNFKELYHEDVYKELSK